jgi:hypothetical protein
MWEQSGSEMKVSDELISAADNNQGLLLKIVTGDNIWYSLSSSQSEWQFFMWK